MNTIFKLLYTENSKTSDPHRLVLNLTDKIDLRKKHKYIALSNFSICYTWKNKNNNLRIIIRIII